MTKSTAAQLAPVATWTWGCNLPSPLRDAAQQYPYRPPPASGLWRPPRKEHRNQPKSTAAQLAPVATWSLGLNLPAPA